MRKSPKRASTFRFADANERPHWLRISWNRLNCWNSKLPWQSMRSGRKTRCRSIRSIETVRPLADALHLKINDTYMRDDFEQMVEEIRRKPEYEGRSVLICWEHKLIPKIARKFEAENVPKTWPDATYDRTWMVKFQHGEKPRCADLPQRLMFGDSPK